MPGYAQWQVDRSQDEVYLSTGQESTGQHRDAQGEFHENGFYLPSLKNWRKHSNARAHTVPNSIPNTKVENQKKSIEHLHTKCAIVLRWILSPIVYLCVTVVFVNEQYFGACKYL